MVLHQVVYIFWMGDNYFLEDFFLEDFFVPPLFGLGVSGTFFTTSPMSLISIFSTSIESLSATVRMVVLIESF